MIRGVTLNAVMVAWNAIKRYQAQSAANAQNQQRCYQMEFAFRFATKAAKIVRDGNRMIALNAILILNYPLENANKFARIAVCPAI